MEGRAATADDLRERRTPAWLLGLLGGAAVAAIAGDASTTTVECPSEKKKPAVMGLWPWCISFRVTLSIAAM